MINTISKTLKDFDYIDVALLFGSYVKGDEKFLSDIDIAINTTKKITLLELGYIVATLEDALNKKVDLVILNELYKKNPLLAYNIYINHKEIFVKNKKAYNNFKFYALKYYMDTKPLYEMTNQQMLERLNNGTFGKI